MLHNLKDPFMRKNNQKMKNLKIHGPAKPILNPDSISLLHNNRKDHETI